MPRFDRTGPEGKGSQTGRSMGKCSPNAKNMENNDEFILGRGMGRRTGRGGSEKGNGRGIGRRLRFKW